MLTMADVDYKRARRFLILYDPSMFLSSLLELYVCLSQIWSSTPNTGYFENNAILAGFALVSYSWRRVIRNAFPLVYRIDFHCLSFNSWIINMFLGGSLNLTWWIGIRWPWAEILGGGTKTMYENYSKDGCAARWRFSVVRKIQKG